MDEREMLPTKLFGVAVGVPALVGYVHKEISLAIDQRASDGIFYSPATARLMAELGIDPQRQMGRWVNTMVHKDKQGKIVYAKTTDSIRTYHDFLLQSTAPQTDETLQYAKTVAEFLVNETPEHAKYISGLTDRHPMVGAATLHLFARACNSEILAENGIKDSDPKLGWYISAVDQAVYTDRAIDSTFDKLHSRGLKTRAQLITLSFLEDLRNELKLHTAEALSLLNIHAIGVLAGLESGFISDALEYNVRTGEFEYARQQVYALDRYALFRDPSRRVFELLDQADPSAGILNVPFHLSYLDVNKYLNHWEYSWGLMDQGIKPQGPHPVKQTSDGASIVSVGSQASILIRENPFSNGRASAQARIAFRGTNGIARVDNEGRRLSLDLGGHSQFDDGLSYAEMMANMYSLTNLLQGYRLTVDDLGRIIPTNQGLYPDLWQQGQSYYDPHGNRINFSREKQSSMVAASVVRHGLRVGLRDDPTTFSNHTRGRLTNNIYMQSFPQIAADLREMLLQAVN